MGVLQQGSWLTWRKNKPSPMVNDPWELSAGSSANVGDLYRVAKGCMLAMSNIRHLSTDLDGGFPQKNSLFWDACAGEPVVQYQRTLSGVFQLEPTGVAS